MHEQLLVERVEQLDEGDQVVVVSKRLCVLDALEKTASQEKRTVLRLDGNTDASSRMERLLVWNSNPTYNVFVLAKMPEPQAVA